MIYGGYAMRAFIFLCIIALSPTTLARETYEDFLKGVERTLIAEGLHGNLVLELFGENPEPSSFIIDRYRPRPPCECTVKPAPLKFEENQKRYLSDTRIETAKGWLRDPETLAVLEKIEAEYNVDKEVLVALWSIESSFGNNKGGHYLPEVLATLAWYHKEKRNAFFRKELINAIRIYAAGHISKLDFVGSWAGAMGHVQFMPSTFLAYAVDYDGDGKADIWNNKYDAFASAANYLSALGWQRNAPWKDSFVLESPIRKGIFYRTGLSKRYVFKRNSEGNVVYKNGAAVIKRYKPYRLPARIFKKRGVPVPNHVNLDEHVYLYLPHGNEEGLEGYLLYRNFHVVLSWNLSSYFAFGILSIMDELKHGPA